jgi:hypothetical protein
MLGPNARADGRTGAANCLSKRQTEDARELPVLVNAHSYCGDPTFDMSGGPKGVKRPLERPLHGGIRRHHYSGGEQL